MDKSFASLGCQSWRAYAAGSGLSLALCGAALGDTLSSESSVGLSSGYNSNPFLEPSGAKAAESLAVLANLPATYTSNTQSLDLIPRLRFAETHGDEALLSNYQYLDGVWRVNGPLNTLTVTADWHHDSTFYAPFENAAVLGRDLRRQEETANLDWRRDLTERNDLHLSASWDKVNYSQSVATGVQNYSYGQVLVQFDRALNERWLWTSSVGVGRYELIGQSYRSDDRFAQTALKRALSERWSLTAQVGYAYLSSRAQGYICCQILLGPNGYYLQATPVSQSQSRGAPNFTLAIERKTERLVLDLAVSRAIQPSGLGGLLTQDDVSLKASIPWTERLTLGATLHGARITDPLQQLALGDRRYADFDLNATWLWTEHWTLQLQGAYFVQRLISAGPSASSTSVYLNLLRQFGRIRL
jgi:hypothetical protein